MNLDFSKNKDGLVPAVIQDNNTNKVLMLGYLNNESLTLRTNVVHFYSRTKQRIWKKGEESGNELNVVSLKEDCDLDTLLIKVNPVGPVCHKGDDTCFKELNISNNFIDILENIIEKRKNNLDKSSYISNLFNMGMNKIAQKLGEEAVEMIIESKDSNHKLFLEESADLLFHYLILLQNKGFKLEDVINVLKKRHK